MRYKKIKKKLFKGVVYVQSNLANIIVTVTSVIGDVVCWASGGTSGFKGKRKGSPFAGQITTENAIFPVIEQGFRQCDIMMQGPGRGRDTSLRTIVTTGIGIGLIRDVTPIAHNGCRAPKRRRT